MAPKRQAKQGKPSHHSERNPRGDPNAARAPARRDIVVIGASAGGIETLTQFVAGLPLGFPGAIFVVQHIPSSPFSALPEILSRSGPLPAAHARHGEPIRTGRIYVAPPDYHVTLTPDHMRVVQGPRENGHRPAVDPLFRSAARVFGTRVIGVVLTGARDCGTHGLMTIKARGGIAIVQDPAEAVYPDMPRHALDAVKIDHVVRIKELAPLVKALVGQPVPWPRSILAQDPAEGLATLVKIFTCPECGGALTETTESELDRYQCHVGHCFSLDGLEAGQIEQVEMALWSALRSLQESIALAERMAQKFQGNLAVRFAEETAGRKRHAETLRAMLLGEALGRADFTRRSAPKKTS